MLIVLIKQVIDTSVRRVEFPRDLSSADDAVLSNLMASHQSLSVPPTCPSMEEYGVMWSSKRYLYSSSWSIRYVPPIQQSSLRPSLIRFALLF
jgi:hypothetical protein